MTEYYLQRADKSCWDKVDEYTFKNREHVTKGDGTRRYSDNVISRGEEGITINVEAMDQQDLSLVMRFLAVREFQGSVNGGIVQSPDFVKIKKGNSVILHEMHGDNFKKS